jgi:hypothetical protein
LWQHSISGKILVRADQKYTLDNLEQKYSASSLGELDLKIEVRKKTIRTISETVNKMKDEERSGAQAALEYLKTQLLLDEVVYSQRCNAPPPAVYPPVRKKAQEHFADVKTTAILGPCFTLAHTNNIFALPYLVKCPSQTPVEVAIVNNISQVMKYFADNDVENPHDLPTTVSLTRVLLKMMMLLCVQRDLSPPELEALLSLYFIFREFMPYGEDIMSLSAALEETSFLDVTLSTASDLSPKGKAEKPMLNFLLPQGDEKKEKEKESLCKCTYVIMYTFI